MPSTAFSSSFSSSSTSSNNPLAILKLTTPEDLRLLDHIIQWLDKVQLVSSSSPSQPLFLETDLRDAIAVLIARLLRAFSFRSNLTTFMTTTSNVVANHHDMNHKSAVTAKASQTHVNKNTATASSSPTATAKTTVASTGTIKPPPTKLMQPPMKGRPITTTTNMTTPRPQSTKTKSPAPFDAAKMIRQLELSCPVVEALVGLASDMAASLHVSHKNSFKLSSSSPSSSSQTNTITNTTSTTTTLPRQVSHRPRPLTVTQVSSKCLWLLEHHVKNGWELLYRHIMVATATTQLPVPVVMSVHASPVMTKGTTTTTTPTDTNKSPPQASPASTTTTTTAIPSTNSNDNFIKASPPKTMITTKTTSTPPPKTTTTMPPRPNTTDPLDELKFKMFMSKSLQELIKCAAASTEAYADFCYMYAVCEENPIFRATLTRLAEYDVMRGGGGSGNSSGRAGATTSKQAAASIPATPTSPATSNQPNQPPQQPLNTNNNKRKHPPSSGADSSTTTTNNASLPRRSYEHKRNHMKKLSWKLSCLVTLYLRSRTSGDGATSKSHDMTRRQRLMLSAASLALLASFPSEMTTTTSLPVSGKKPTESSPGGVVGVATIPNAMGPPTSDAIKTSSIRTDGSAWNVVEPKARHDDSSSETPMALEEEDEDKHEDDEAVVKNDVDDNTEESSGESPAVKKRRVEGEESSGQRSSTTSMASSSCASWSEGSEDGDHPPKDNRDGNTGKNKTDVVDVIVHAVNNIRNFLAWAAPQNPIGEEITKAQVHWEMLNLVEHALKDATSGIKGSNGRQADTALVYQCLQSQLIKPTLWKTYAEIGNIERLYQATMSLFTSKPWTGAPTKRRLEAVPFVDEACLNGDLIARLCPTSHSRTKELNAPTVLAVTLNYHDPSSRVLTMVGERVVRPSTPPIISEAMELNEWTVSLLSFTVIKPNARLLSYLDACDQLGNDVKVVKDMIVPILNRALLHIMENAGACINPPGVSVSSLDGAACVEGLRTLDKQVYASLVALYYHTLEAILFQETTRIKTRAHPKLLHQISFHRALVAWCYICLLKAIGTSEKMKTTASHPRFDIYSILQLVGTSPYTYLKISEGAGRALTFELARDKLGSPMKFGLPRIIQRHLKFAEVQVLDSLIWAREGCLKEEGSIMFSVKELMSKSTPDVRLWPPEPLETTLPEEIEDIGAIKTNASPAQAAFNEEGKFVAFVIRKLLNIVYFRIQVLCNGLAIPSAYPVARQTFLAFRHLLRQHMGLLNDRHVDQLLLCTLYGIAKSMKYQPEIKFARLIEVYVAARSPELGERTCQRIVRHLKLVFDDNTAKASKRPAGNIIDLYNSVFVPAMKFYLLRSKSLKRNTVVLEQLQNAKSGASESAPAPNRLTADKVVIREGNVAVEVTLSSSGKGSVGTRLNGSTQGFSTFLYFGGCQSRPIDVTNELVTKANLECGGE